MRYFRLINGIWLEVLEDQGARFTGLYVRARGLYVELCYQEDSNRYLLCSRGLYGFDSYEYSKIYTDFYLYYTKNNFKKFKRLVKKLGIDD